jgi:hypothetical protein
MIAGNDRPLGGGPTGEVGPREPAALVGRARKLWQWWASSWPNDGGGMARFGRRDGSTSRGCSADAPLRHQRGRGSGGTGGAGRTVGHKATCWHQVNRRRAAIWSPSSAIAQRRLGKARWVPCESRREVSASQHQRKRWGLVQSCQEKTRPPSCKQRRRHLHRLHFRWQPRPSRGESRIALGQ